jgi:hypothetical protein
MAIAPLGKLITREKALRIPDRYVDKISYAQHLFVSQKYRYSYDNRILYVVTETLLIVI